MSTSHSTRVSTSESLDNERIREAARQLAKAVAQGMSDWAKAESPANATTVRKALREALLTELQSAADAALAWAIDEPSESEVQPVSEALRLTDSEEGRLSVLREVTSGPYPRYHALPGVDDLLLRTEANGEQTIGRFVGREFRAIG